MRLPIFFVLFIALNTRFACTPVSAEAKSHINNYTFHKLSTADGLSNNNISEIVKDYCGYMWIGTEYGLNRYDGHSCEKYYFSQESTGHIEHVFEDVFKNLWIDVGHFMVYDRHNNKFVNPDAILKSLNFGNENFHSIMIDNDNEPWIIMDNRIVHIKADKTHHTYKMTGATQIRSIVKQNSTLYLSVGCRLLSLDLKTNAITEIPLDNELDNGTMPELTLYGDESSDLWAFSKERNIVMRKSRYTDRFDRVLLPETECKYVIRDIIDDRQGNIWIATDNNGAYIIDKNTGIIINEHCRKDDNTSMSSDKINKLYIDDDSTVWLAHYKGGVSFLRSTQSRVHGVNVNITGAITSMMECSDGSLLLATDGAGLLRQSGNNEFSRIPIDTRTVTSVTYHPYTGLWIGTYLDGLYQYSDKSIRHFTTSNSDIPDNNIWDVKIDRKGKIWCGTLQKGLYRYDTETGKFTQHLRIPKVSLIQRLYYDGGDTLLVATNAGLGIVNIDTYKETFLSNDNADIHLPTYFIRAVYRDSYGIIWIGYGGGIMALDLNTGHNFTINTDNGLCDNLVSDIIEDDDRNMWVSTGNGLSMISLNRSAGIGDKYIEKIVSYSQNNGLVDNEVGKFTPLSDGRIAVASQRGYDIIYPNIESGIKKSYPPRITYITVNNNIHKVITVNDSTYEMTVKSGIIPDKDFIGIHFSAFNYNNVGKQQYAYQIDNSNQWKVIRENYVTLGPLSSGKYSLRIKACDTNGEWNDDICTLYMTICPPFWMSDAAICLYILIVIALAIYIRNRIKSTMLERIRKRNMEQEALKRDEMLTQKMDFLTNISHDIRTPLSLIISPLQKLHDEAKDHTAIAKNVDIAYKNAQYLLDLVNQLLDMRRIDVKIEKYKPISGNINNFLRDVCESFKVYAEMNGRTLTYNSETGDLRMLFDKDKLKRIMYNLLSNAAKFTPKGGIIEVQVKQDGNNLCFSVSDNGIGIPDNQKDAIFKPFFQLKQKDVNHGAGIGLYISKEYITLHGGTITVTDNSPHGSRFICRIPIETTVNEIIPEETDDSNATQTYVQSERPVILLVEDNVEFRRFLGDSLAEKYTVITADDGLAAIKYLKDQNIDIIISDVMMPNLNGNRLCEIVKTTIEWSHIPVILLTARTSDEHCMEGLRFGADDYLTKPVNLKLLDMRIVKFLEWRARCHMKINENIEIEATNVTISEIDNDFLCAVRAIIEENISNSSYSVNDFCTEMNMSSSNLYRKFMAIIGQPPLEYMRVYRLRKARQQLKKGCSISEIAYNYGFTHPKYFSKYFKEQYGITPSQYIKNM